MLKIDHKEMSNILNAASQADTKNLKTLTDTERKTLKVIALAIREGKAFINEDEKTLISLKGKLFSKEQKTDHTPLLQKL